MKKINAIKKEIENVNIEKRLYKDEPFIELSDLAYKYDLEVDKLDDFYSEDSIDEIIKDQLTRGSWDLQDLAWFMEGVNFRSDDFYIISDNKLYNIEEEDLKELKDQMIEKLLNK